MNMKSYKCFGMLQTLPLPGSYKYAGRSIDEIIEYSMNEARSLRECGFDGAIVQNMGDMPIRQQSSPEAISCLSVVTRELKRTLRDFEIGVLVNWDGVASVAVAAASGADFVRVEHVYTGAEVTSCGLLQAQAPEICAARKRIGTKIPIFADVQEPHGVAVGAKNIAAAAWETVYEACADGIFLSGATAEDSLRMAEEAAKKVKVPIYLGGGANGDNVYELLRRYDGVCVATWIKNGSLANPIDPVRAKRIISESKRAEKDAVRITD